MATLYQSASSDSQILTSAVSRIAELWGLSNAKFGAVLGVSPATASRLKSGQAQLDPATKSFEAGQFLLRLFRALDALMGSDDDASRRWLASANLDLAARPFDLIDTLRGLITLCDYVDSYRARV